MRDDRGGCHAVPPRATWVGQERTTSRRALVEPVCNAALIHAGGSGVGSAGIQLAARAGAEVFVTAGSDAKILRCKELGASDGVNYKTQDFVAEIKQLTGGQGVDLIQDFVGAAYLEHNLKLLSHCGRLVLVEPITPSRRVAMREVQESHHEIGIDYARADLEAAGFEILDARDPFIKRKSQRDEMWLLVGRRPMTAQRP